jgi:hypothetical protein
MNMSVKQHQECYGGLMPDFEHLRYNRPTEGKAFRVFVENIGVGTQRRELTFKSDSWDECLDCPEYRACYDLSMAKLALSTALARC